MSGHRYRRPTLDEIITAHRTRFPGGLTRAGGQYEGQCPACGGTDRFSVQVRDASVWCRNCQPGRKNPAAFKEIMVALDLYGLPMDTTPDPGHRAHRAAERTDAERTAAAMRFLNSASCVPIAGTPAEAWLRERKIHTLSDSLGYRHDARHRGQNLPCMLATVVCPRSGEFMAVLRTFFTTGPRAERMFLGAPKGGGIMLNGSADSRKIIVVEGLEDGLSIIQAGVPHTVWATGGCNMARFRIPQAAEYIIIAADPDAAGNRAALALAEKSKRENPAVGGVILPPPKNAGDWNQMLIAGRHREIRNRLNR